MCFHNYLFILFIYFFYLFYFYYYLFSQLFHNIPQFVTVQRAASWNRKMRNESNFNNGCSFTNGPFIVPDHLRKALQESVCEH